MIAAADLPVPTLVQNIGRSTNGRSLRVVRRGADGAGVDVLVVGVIHGNEAAGRAIIQRLRYARPAPCVRYWLVPTINPDGQARGTRQNARGVDLNRNFPTAWRRTGAPWDTYYPGRAAASERETRAVQALIKRVRPDVTIWYHQRANQVIRQPVGWPRSVTARYARVSKLPLKPWPVSLGGTATGWQAKLDRASAPFVVELPAGTVAAPALTRHVAAVDAVARDAVRHRSAGC